MNPDSDFYAFSDRVIALAGAFQALSLVQQSARSGIADDRPLTVCVRSVLRIDAPTAMEVYGNIHELRLGLQTLQGHLARSPDADFEVGRYWMGVMALERKLNKQRQHLDAIANGLPPLVARAEAEGVIASDVIEGLAELYKQNVSTLTPRIMVSGEPRYLNDPTTANRIRALLLAAIRAVVLWRQVGGTRLGLLFSSKPLLGATSELLRDTEEEWDDASA